MTEFLLNINPVFPKDFQYENKEIKEIVGYLNGINVIVNDLLKIIQTESQSSKRLNESNIKMISDTQTELQDISKNSETFLTEKLNCLLQSYTVFYTKIKEHSCILDIQDILQKINNSYVGINKKIESFSSNFETLTALKNNLKLLEVKEGKISKEIQDQNEGYLELKNDEKKSYNLTLREKNYDSLLSSVNDFDTNNEQKVALLNECQKMENTINDGFKEFFAESIQIFSNNIKKFKKCFDCVTTDYQKKINFMIKEVLSGLLEKISANTEEKDKEKIPSFNIEAEFKTSDPESNNLPEKIIKVLKEEATKISTNKKYINKFIKFLKSIDEQISMNMSYFDKDIKAMLVQSFNDKKVRIDKTTMLAQMTSFIRSLFELYFKKFEDKNRVRNNVLLSPLEAYLKDLTTEEATLSSNISKLNKEISNFKAALTEKEKAETDFNSLQETFLKDPSTLRKKEKEVLSSKSEANKAKSKFNDAFLKLSPILSDINETIIKTFLTQRKDKEEKRVKEITNGCKKLLEFDQKTLNQINDYFTYKSQIKFDEEEIKTFVKSTFANFGVTFKLSIPEQFYSSYSKEDLKDIYFLNDNQKVTLETKVELKSLLEENLLEKIRTDIQTLKSAGKDMASKNLYTGKLFEEIFQLDNDEEVYDKYSCALKEGILLQGKLYLTTKKLVFYSWFNQSTLFGKTMVIIPKEDIKSIEKKDDSIINNPIEIMVKSTPFLFCSFAHKEECYAKLRSLCFGEPLPEGITLEPKSKPKTPKQVEVEKEASPKAESKGIIRKESRPNESVPEYSIMNKIIEYSNTRYTSFLSKTKGDLVSEVIKDKSFGDISLPEIFLTIFNPNNSLPIFGNKSFNVAYAEKRQDYNLDITKIDSLSSVPEFYLTGSIEDFKKYENEEPSKDIEKVEYKIKCTHPILKKRFGGPSKLEISDKFVVYFVSPICLVVEDTSMMSGFMLMDTFKTTNRYVFTSDVNFVGDKMIFETKLTISFLIEFVKDTWWKSRITAEAKEDTNSMVNEIMLPLMTTVIDYIKQQKEIPDYSLNKNLVSIEKIKKEKERRNSLDGVNPPSVVKKQNEEIKIDTISREEIYDVLNILLEKKGLGGLSAFIIFIGIIMTFSKEFALLIGVNLICFGLLFWKLYKIEKKLNEIKFVQDKK